MRLKVQQLHLAVAVLIVLSAFPQSCHGANIPAHWVTYLKWLKSFYVRFPQFCLPQTILPNQLMLTSHIENGGQQIQGFIDCLPPVLVWHPLAQYPLYFPRGQFACPNCESELIVGKWNIGEDRSSQPRIVQDIDSIVLLVGVVYSCHNHHKFLSYDPRILSCFPKMCELPFALSHRTGFSVRLLNVIIAQVEVGKDFSHTLSMIKSCRLNHPIKSCTNCRKFDSPLLSRFTITSIFLQQFFLQKELLYNNCMISIICNGWLSIDHTFKVASNIGYFRSDGRWVTQYKSLFIVMNELGEVMSWQLTRTESTAEVKELLTLLNYRCKSRNVTVHSIILDNCCQWQAFLQGVFGVSINVKLDLFHAVQRISRTLSKNDKYYSQFLSELRMMFRFPGDLSKNRSMPTPTTSVLLENYQAFCERWKGIGVRDTTLKELNNIKKHIMKGCLSDIPPGVGTNRNEAIHRHINPYFNKSTLGVHSAYALLCLLFFMHNRKIGVKRSSNSSSAGGVATSNSRIEELRLAVSNDHSYMAKEKFGIVGKVEAINGQKFWGISHLSTFEEAMEVVSEIENGDDGDIVDNNVAKQMITDVLDIVETAQSLDTMFSQSPLLNKDTLPFVSCDNSSSAHDSSSTFSDHQVRLDKAIRLCAMTRVFVPGDGNCCFVSIALALKTLYRNACQRVKVEMKSLPVNIEDSVDVISFALRNLLCQEWLVNQGRYEDYVSSTDDFQEEASKFLANGFFTSSLGDVVVPALSNALHIPIIMITSITNMPLIHFKPCSYAVFTPLIVAFNQYGAGHYDAVQFHSGSSDRVSILPSNCRCGVNIKGGSTRKCVNSTNYRSRCPCLNNSTHCSSLCKCKNCDNPHGKKSTTISHPIVSRKRQRHQLNSYKLKSSTFMIERDEVISKGEWSLFENILVSVIVNRLQSIKGSARFEDVHAIYHKIVKLATYYKLGIPISFRSMSGIIQKIQQQKKHQEYLNSC